MSAKINPDSATPRTKAATRADINNLGGFSGALAQSPADAAPSEMFQGDLDTASALGARFAKFVAGHKAA